MAAIGIITELVRKSKKSKISIFSIVTFFKTLNPSAESVPSAKTITVVIDDALNLDHFISSSNVDTTLSARATELVSAARNTNKKNIIPIMK